MTGVAAVERNSDAKALSILFVMPTYLPESFGGAEQQARKMAAALRSIGVAVTIITPTTLNLPAHEYIEGIPVIRLRYRHLPSLGGRYMPSFIRWCLELPRWMKEHEHEYDVVHVFHARLHAAPAVVAGRRLGKPTLIKNGRGGEHFEYRRMVKRPLYGRWIQRLIQRSTDAYIANSEEIAADLAAFGVPEHAILRIPNGVEIPEGVVPGRGGTLRCVYLGRIDPEKNIEMMIRGFAKLPESVDARLAIVGDGESREALEALTLTVDTRHRISFTGAVTDVDSIYRDADVFLSTSESEGMSNSMLEAMSYAVVPVVSNVSGVSDLVQDGVNGRLFVAGDEDDFVRCLSAVSALAAAQRGALGLAGRERMIEGYGIDAVARRHVEAYTALLAKPLPAVA